MSSCRNATRPGEVRGLLRPDETARQASLWRDADGVSPALRPYVERYWSVRWDRTGRPPYRSEVLSHPAVNLSIETGDRPRFGAALPAALLHDVVTRRFVVDLAGVGSVTAVRFRPGGFTAMTGLPPAPDTRGPLPRELGLDPAVLIADVLAHEDDAARVARLDRALVPLAGEPSADYLELCALLTRVQDDRALVRVEQVARLAGRGVRSLQRLFAAYVGVAPKAVLARYRLQDAVAAIDAGEVTDLAALAAAYGWADQAHFSRDFRAVVGTTPSAYLQRAREVSS